MIVYFSRLIVSGSDGNANMMYVMRKQLTPDQIEEVFRKLNLIFEFADFSPAVLERAVNPENSLQTGEEAAG